MKRFLPLSVAIAVAALTVAGTASAQVSPSALPPPPTASNAASSSIFDAFLAIARAAGSNPGAVGAATLTYNTAIQQYNSGDLQHARMTALSAIAQTAAGPLPAPSLNPPVIPQPNYVPMPSVNNPDQAYAEGYVGLARKAVMLCGAPGAALPAGIQTQYSNSVNALVALHYVAAREAATAVIEQCATAASAYAATLQAQPAPSPMGSYMPEPIATLGPDPALAATPVPLMIPSATPVPARRGFHL
jgi:hypothetical protein